MTRAKLESSEHFDALIVGSGAGGAAAAYRLARAGLKVLLLEKGDPLPTDGSTLDVARVVTRGEFLSREVWQDGDGQDLRPEEHFNLGGKTKWYGAALLRYAPHEFDADSAHGCRAWPISYRDLEPYYVEAERLLGVREFECETDLARILSRLAHRWRAHPLPMGLAPEILDDPHEAAHFDGFASVRDLKGDAQTSILSRVASNALLTTLTGVEVESLLADPENRRRIVGVRTRDGREFRADATLLAAGALHSPRLLQRFLDRAGLTDLPLSRNVGRNLKLHLLTAMVAVGAGAQRDLLRKTTLLLHEQFPHSSVQPLGFDAELIAQLIPPLVPRFAARPIASRSYGFFLQTEDGAHPDNRVLDATAADPRPTLDYSATRVPVAELEHRRFTRAFQRALVGAGFISFTQRIGLAGTAHVQGTLTAGNDPATSVVDTEGRVHGLESLYVVDGSVLPRSSRANPSLTIYAWALRVAALLANARAAQTRDAKVVPGVEVPA